MTSTGRSSDDTLVSGTGPGDDDVEDVEDLDEDRSFHELLRRRRLMTPATRVLVAALVLVTAFVGGALVQRNFGTDDSAGSAIPGLPEGFPFDLSSLPFGGGGGAAGDGSGAAAGFGQLMSGGGGVTGTIRLIDGTFVYIAGVDGSITKVALGDDTQITLTSQATAADLAPSLVVTVQGDAGEDGTIAATSITQQAMGTPG